MRERTDDFSIGRVIAQGLAAVARRPAATCVPALLFGVPPAWLIGYATEGSGGGDEVAIGLIFASLWVGAVTNVVSQGAIAPAVLADDAPLGRVSRSLAPLAAAGALIGFATVVTGALLVVPGLLLYALWSVAGPAIVAERLGPLAGLRRSAALVRPVFWRVLLLNALLILAYAAFWLALGLAGLYCRYGPAAFIEDFDTPLPVGFYLLSAPFLTLATAAWGAVVAALYADLRERLDGVPADRLARIFA